MSEKKKTRSDQEWLDLIQECRASGLPDKEWCQLHSISIKTFLSLFQVSGGSFQFVIVPIAQLWAI